MGSFASGQPFQLALQSLLLVLGCGQLALRNILFVSQLFQFFAHGQLLLSDNGQNKSDQLFTVDRLWLGRFQFFIAVKFRTTLIAFFKIKAHIHMNETNLNSDNVQ